MVVKLFSTDQQQGVNFAIKQAIFSERQANNTPGGTFTNGAYRTRVLNNEDYNAQNIASINTSTGEITITQTGIYKVTAFANAHAVAEHKLRLQSTSGDSIQKIGDTKRTTSGVANNSSVTHIFEITQTTVIVLQHRCVSTNGTDGLGQEANFGDIETYAGLTLEQLSTT
ncbi:hypothetical protein [Candidatus Uabimicrobium sp. HlEnr_7]|uniref:hypothetical protein n=1 Tax=Candidatus Uabimicrobium helgolandensis TaxID=3095367 RepID=UPI0035581BA0